MLRCKPGPAAKLLPSAHAVEREYRVQAALAGGAVPVARVHCLCEDESVLGRAFYVMDHVEGRIFWQQALPDSAPADRAALYDAMNAVIASLHGVDVAAAGLADYGRGEHYVARQVARWSKQYAASAGEPIPAMDRLIAWLPAHVPADDAPPVALVHGDYRIDNLIYAPDAPRVAAVIDWELSTLGHPLADFAYHLMSWHLPPGPLRGLAGLDLAALGIPDEAAYIAAYERRSGRTVAGDMDYYLAYNLFRLAAILQGVAARARAGIASSAQAVEVGRQAAPLAELGWRFAQRAGA